MSLHRQQRQQHVRQTSYIALPMARRIACCSSSALERFSSAMTILYDDTNLQTNVLLYLFHLLSARHVQR